MTTWSESSKDAAYPLLDPPVMRRVLFPLAALLVLGGTAGANGLAGIYVQGHGGYGGTTATELAPGGDDPGLGAALGGELGIHVMAFGAYVNYDRHLNRGSIFRAILGFEGGLTFAGFRLSGRAGGGLIFDNDGLLMGREGDHNGVVGRAGVAFDRRLAPGLWLGLGIDGEYFALKGDDGGVESDVHTGADVFASLRLTFEVGI